jgi:acyl dehydratase
MRLVETKEGEYVSGRLLTEVWEIPSEELRAGKVQPNRMRAFPRERFVSNVTLTPAMVSAYASAAGDTNPVHHDSTFAAATRYGRPIASGTFTTALLLGLTASHYSKSSAMLGLEFWVRFRRPIYADETIRLEWLVVKVTPNPKLDGDVVELRGRIQNERGETALGAKGRILVTALLNRIPITKARVNLGQLAKRAHLNNEYFILEKDGIPVIGITDADELEDYLELRDPEVKAQIRQSNKDVRAGRTRPAEALLHELVASSVKPSRRRSK